MIARYDMSPSGYFAAQVAQVGTTDEEMAAFARNELAAERIRVILGRLQFAAVALHHTIPHGTS